MKDLYEIYLKSSGVSTDTRSIAPNSLFFALRGDNFDANTMVAEALDKGALHVVTTNRQFADNKRCTLVDDTLVALQSLASYHRSNLDIPIVGITGTNGKTTTKELIASVLRSKYEVFATRGNLNNHIGVPLSLLAVRNVDIAVIEMGASHPHEIAELAAIAQPTCGLVTNVGIGHIEGFGSFEGVKATKAELYAQLRNSNSTIFINATNPNLVEMLGDYEHVVSYGTDADFCRIDGQACETSELLSFEWRDGDGVYREVNTQLTGAYNLENALAAVAVGRFFDVSEADICNAITNYTPTNGRSQVVRTAYNKVIMDAYNANPSSMMASLDNFVKLSGEHKVVILGAMRELGAEQDEHHLALMKKVEAAGFDKVILVGREFEKFATQFPSFFVCQQASETFDQLKELKNKSILVKGSHSNHLETLIDKL